MMSDQTRVVAQFGIAAIGVLVGTLGILGMIVTPALIENGSGFAGGLAILFFGVHALGGWMLAAIGFLIPQAQGRGVQFDPLQRRLLVWGVIGPILGIGGYLIGIRILPPLSDPLQVGAVVLLILILVSGPVAVVASVASSPTIKRRARQLRG